jgi:HEAT repeat protein
MESSQISRHSRPDSRAARAAVLFLFLSLLIPTPGRAQVAPDPKLEQAVASLRNIVPDKLSDAQQEAKSKEIEEAWAVIRAAGQKGLARLKGELRRIGERKESDDFFKLNASALLWEIGKFDEAAEIAEIWSTTPLSVSYNYAFYTAIEAAREQDERALPMLRAILRDKEGRTFFARHAMEVPFPLTHEFVWGAFGPKGLPALARVLETSRDTTELTSAMRLLAHAQYLESLPRIRQIASSGAREVKFSAVGALGIFGHPQDYEFLLAGVKSSDPEEALLHAFALYEFEDLRAVPHLTPLLKSPNQLVRMEAISALRHLTTPDSLAALREHSETTKSAEEKQRVERIFEQFSERTKTNWQEFRRKSPEGQKAFVTEYRQKFEDEHRLEEGEKPWPRGEFLAMAARWKERGRLEKEGGEVGVRHILSAATAGDIPLLLEVKSRLYLRLSDECLYETRRIDEAVKLLGRGRYRKTPGTTERAEAK